MKVNKRCWGQVTVVKWAGRKQIDSSKSFSINSTRNKLSLEEISELFKLLINLSEVKEYETIRKMIKINIERGE